MKSNESKFVKQYYHTPYRVDRTLVKKGDRYYYNSKIVSNDTGEVIATGLESTVSRLRSSIDKKFSDLNYKYQRERDELLAYLFPITDFDKVIAEVNNHRPTRNSADNVRYLVNKRIVPGYQYRDEENHRTVVFFAGRDMVRATIELDEEYQDEFDDFVS